MDLDDEELKATRKLNGSDTREHRIYAIKFAVMQKQIDEKDKRIQELEEKLEKANRQLDLDYVDDNYIPKQKVKELKESILLEPTIVGGRRNKKTLEYGIKLGKIKLCEEQLEDK